MTRARRADKVARRDARWRGQAARLIGQSGSIVSMASAADQYVRFDVVNVRAYCERLIADADALDQQREVFKDWTRVRGMGPEHHARFTTRYRLFAVTPCGESATSIDVWHRGGDVWRIEVQPSSLRGTVVTASTMRTPMVERWRLVGGVLEIVAVDVQVSPDAAGSVSIACVDDAPYLGGWPGRLAREFVAAQRARRRCSRRDCDSGVLVGSFLDHLGRLGTVGHAFGGAAFTVTEKGGAMRVACPECEAFAVTRTSRAFVNGGNIRRAAQRLIDTLDGRCQWNPDAPAQPSECQTCDGRGETGPEWTAPAGAVLHARVPLGFGFDRAEHVGGPCIACNGTGHNLRGTLPPLPEETIHALLGGGRRIRGARFDTAIVDDAAFGREE